MDKTKEKQDDRDVEGGEVEMMEGDRELVVDEEGRGEEEKDKGVG
jgi:hypothetical protein